jgi:hypothetical protein
MSLQQSILTLAASLTQMAIYFNLSQRLVKTKLTPKPWARTAVLSTEVPAPYFEG